MTAKKKRRSGTAKKAAKSPSARDAEPMAEDDQAEDASPDDVSLLLSPTVVADIVRREALNAPGVTEIAPSSFIGRSKGISITEEPGPEGTAAYRVEMHIYVQYGTNCLKLRDALAERVAASVRKMTGREVLSLGIHVEGVRDPVPDEGVSESPDTPMIDY